MRPLDRWLKFWVTLSELKLLSMAQENVGIYDATMFAEKHYAMPKVVIVGTNPSRQSDNMLPFDESTKSGTTVRFWFNDFTYGISYKNLYNGHTIGNKVPKKSDCEDGVKRIALYASKGYKIVSCGAFVDRMLKDANIKHFPMPHPSGLNRFWNDKVAREAKIAEMHKWIAKP